MRISDGVLVIDGTDRSERLRLTGIAGEVSAPALHGPYRFRGVYGDENARRDVRLSTTEADSDGSIRYKLAVKHSTPARPMPSRRALPISPVQCVQTANSRPKFQQSPSTGAPSRPQE